jgi:hypothetical protein
MATQQQQQPLIGSASMSSITVTVGADGSRQCRLLLLTSVASGCGSCALLRLCAVLIKHICVLLVAAAV